MGYVARDKASVWHPYTTVSETEFPIFIEKAEGSYLYTEEGKAILDAVGSWWVNLHGHSHPYIAEKIAAQAQRLEHVMFAGFTHKPAIELAEALLGLFKGRFSKVFYSDNGSTSIEVALKMCFQFWYNQGLPKKKVLALEGAYHGDTFGAMSVGERSVFTQAFQSFLFDVEYLSLSEEAIPKARELMASGDVACFIFEPLIQGAAGMVMYEAEWLDRLIGMAKENQVLCIADEVFTGFGRTGKSFAIDHLTEQVDVICLSKGLTGGALPLGATLCTQAIHDAFQENKKAPNDLEGLNIKTFFHGHSFTANPIACAAALASLELFEQASCQASILAIKKKHQDFCEGFSPTNFPSIESVRSKGVVLAITYKAEQRQGYLSEMRNRLYIYFLEKGILMRPLGNTVYVVPPYCITAEELDTIYQAILSFE